MPRITSGSSYFTSADNRHALPLFTSLLNVTCAYDPIGYGVPYNHLMFNDSREALVESRSAAVVRGTGDVRQLKITEHDSLEIEQVEVCWLANFCSSKVLANW
jgi:hypothetical protein